MGKAREARRGRALDFWNDDGHKPEKDEDGHGHNITTNTRPKFSTVVTTRRPAAPVPPVHLERAKTPSYSQADRIDALEAEVLRLNHDKAALIAALSVLLHD
jgi:hypothetical protein